MSKEILLLDKKIIELIGKRSELYINEIKELKKGKNFDIFSHRDELFKLIKNEYSGSLPVDVIQKAFGEILSSSIQKAMPLKVAFLGPMGTFSSMALVDFFGESVEPVPSKIIPEVFRNVETGNANFGVVPIENSTEGAVTFTLDELIETDLNVVSEKYIRISFLLLSKEQSLDEITKVYSHPQPLAQCKGWIRQNLPGAEIVSVNSTTGAAELALKESGSCAITSHSAAEIYDLNVLEKNIEDSRQNYTRFFVIGKSTNSPCGNDKTSIVCVVKDKPAALIDLLKPLSDAGINMSKIESRPYKKRIWEYYFFIDLIGHKDDKIVSEALDKMKSDTLFMKILGSYRIGNI